MVEILYKTISKTANLKIILIVFVLFVIAMVLVNITFATGVQNLTQTFNYIPEKAYEMISGYGESGRQNHIRVLFADIILVILYTVLFSSSILYTASRLFPSKPLVHKLSLLPFVLAAIQFLEIIGVFIVLVSFPRKLIRLTELTNIITMTKVILTYVCMFIPLVGFICMSYKNIIAFVRH